MTLIELTIVILVLLLLTTILFVGAHSWKRGTDRARCVMNIRNMQMSVRAYTNASRFQAGTDLSLEVPPINLLAELAGPGKYVPELPRCPGNGIYYFDGDVIPDVGALYMKCSLAASQKHQPVDYSHW